MVRYFYQQITGDSGPGATLGDFKSRVAGIGPQIGYLFPAGDAGLPEPERLLGIRRREPAGRLEYVADAGFLSAAHHAPPSSTRK